MRTQGEGPSLSLASRMPSASRELQVRLDFGRLIGKIA